MDWGYTGGLENSTVREALTYQFTNTEYWGSRNPSWTGIRFLAPSSRSWQGSFELEALPSTCNETAYQIPICMNKLRPDLDP